ncbi:MAG: hypothetical protein H6558_21220 [Lewinellaceae bacterium]|nr:hypothetical protein [Lewinellaceae bacterium]
MKSIVHNAAPNIVPGTHFTAARFNELYAWASALAADTAQAALGPFQYGLMIPYDGKASLALEQEGSKLALSRCCGITPQGSIVGLFEETHPTLIVDLKQENLHPREEYWVVVEVNHASRRAYGPESPDLPLRPLHSMATYELRLQQAGHAPAARPDAFYIGRLKMETGEWALADYIPPCVHISAHEELQKRYLKYREGLSILLEELPKIVLQTDTYQEKAMIELREFCLQLGSMLAARRHRYSHLSEWGNPFDLFELWAAFAQHASFLLHCLTDRPGFFNLIHENTRGVNGVFFTPQSLDAAIQELVAFHYDHNQINEAVRLTDRFLQMIVPIFKALGIGTLHPSGKKETWQAQEEAKNISFTW